MSRCYSKTHTGKRCKRNTIFRYCKQHKPKYLKKNYEVGTCSICKDECNFCSQLCKRCIRESFYI